MRVQSPAPASIAAFALQQRLKGTVVGPIIGRGRRSVVFAGEWEGTPVVLKCYTKQAVEKYRRRYRVSIAQFEYERNMRFWAAEDLRPFVARPIRALTADDASPDARPAWPVHAGRKRRTGGRPAVTQGAAPRGLCNPEVFVQQRIQGRTLHELLGPDRRLPEDVLRAIDRVVEIAGRHGLHDIDMCPSNFLVQRDADGWRPVLFDFNLMPQHQHPPNPLVGLLYRLGLRHPAHRDRWMLRRLRRWPE